MAEGELKHRLRDRRPGVVVTSAGLGALIGRHAEPLAQELMRERGIDISGHLARQLTPKMIRDHELILVMEAGQQHDVEALLPGARGRVHPIGRWGRFDVPDPFRRDRAAYERALTLILRGLDEYEQAFWTDPA